MGIFFFFFKLHMLHMAPGVREGQGREGDGGGGGGVGRMRGVVGLRVWPTAS